MTMTHEELQWMDFGDRVIAFSGYRWRVKRGGPIGPGNNLFDDSEDCVFVDRHDALHLRVLHRKGKWYCPEIALTDVLGYGDYGFTVASRVDRIDLNLVLGLFLWEYQTDYGDIERENRENEFDMEFSRWKDPARENAQYVCQPWQQPGNENRFEINLDGRDPVTSHAFLWTPNGAHCRSGYGKPETERIQEWNYDGAYLPKNGTPRVHINFWLTHESPSDGKEHEAVISEFHHQKNG